MPIGPVWLPRSSKQAPPEVAEAVVGALASHWARDTGPQLRGRCRTVLSRISPDLLRQRAAKAREQCSLRRYADEPGVDKWEGTFPSEDAARAWAAIDARAHELVADGSVGRIDRARAQALIDLVTGSATITTVVTLTVPAPPVESGGRASASAGPGDPDPDEPMDSSALAEPGDRDEPADRSAPAWPGDRDRNEPADRSAPAGPGDRDCNEPVDSSTPDGSGDSGTDSHDDISRHPTHVDRGVGSAAGPLDRAAQESRGGGSAPTESPDDLIEVAMGTRGERVLVSRAFLDVVTAALDTRRSSGPATGSVGPCSTTPSAPRTVHRLAWRPWCGNATGAAASPAATSPPGSATSTTSDPGRPAQPPPAT